MGKSKKTRWRTLEISGSQDETQTNGADVKLNGTSASDSHDPLTSQKYSQILGDHQTNSSTQFNRNSSHHIYKSRNSGYNNKENFYNQRSGGRLGGSGGQRSWQRGGNYRTSIVNGRDRKTEEGEKAGLNDVKDDSTAEPMKFNEDDYTRITTPRQDVLFKKGYLSRINNKTASNLSAPVNSTESTAASSTITTSDPDSSVSTLSPATTPSMDYGQMDSMDYAPMYYPGYYDENGMLVIPMYNGYNYYPPTNSGGSNSTSPVYLMPYPYQYDPFFMTPGGVQPVDGDENTDEKTETDGAKENNQNTGALSTSSEDGASSDRGDEKKEEKKEATEQNGTENPDEVSSTEPTNPELKQNVPIYPNELNGYMYPAYPNGYYNNPNGYYYYNGAPASRPPKMRRRKRFLNSRNSHQQQPRSAETTTDYSDDETTTQNRRFNPRYQNGWSHHNGYNHFNGKFHRVYVDQNANQAPHEFHLNVDVQEFYPRVHLSDKDPETNVNCDAPSINLERKDTTTAPLPKPKVEAPKVTKTSHPSKQTNRVSKKEIIEGIKSMEQQNIDLAATKPAAATNASQVDEWNVIKKGKKVKVVKDIKLELDVQDVKKDKVEEIKIEEVKVEVIAATTITVLETAKKPTLVQQKSKKSKTKNKKKKPMMVKQNGFEIIEPEFNSAKAEEVVDDETQELSDEEPEITESEVLNVDAELFENLVLNGEIENGENESEIVIEKEIIVDEVDEVTTVKTLEVNDLPEVKKKVVVDDDAVIDISDEDICSKVVIPVEILVKEAQEKIEVPKVVKKLEADKKPEVLKTLEDQIVKKEIQAAKKQVVLPEAVKTPAILSSSEVSSKVTTKPQPEATVKLLSEVTTKPQPEVQSTKKAELKLEIPQPEVLRKLEAPVVQSKPEVVKKQPEAVKKQQEVSKKQSVAIKTPEALPELPQDPFNDADFLNDRTNIAALERDLMENLRLLDDDFDLKSPIINPLYDFPITSAVRKWLQEKETESFDSLFHVQNLRKLSELYEDDDDETESDISEKEMKSETDSDYASDFQAKANGSSPTCSTHAKGSKCNKLIAKESFCALM